MDIVDAMWVGIIGGAGIVAYSYLYRAEKKKLMQKELDQIPEFTQTQLFKGVDGNGAIAVDEERKKVCFIKTDIGVVSSKVHNYRDILKCEIFEDGSTVNATSRTSQIGGALIGGIALGGIGAVVGGLTGKSVSKQKIKTIDLRISINDTASPVHDIRFMDLEVKRSSALYKMQMDECRHWLGLVEIFIRAADAEDKAAEISVSNTAPFSVADELMKLKGLLADNLLTEEEFAHQKYLLLGSKAA